MKRIVNLKTYYKLLLLIVSTSVFFFLLYVSLYLYTIHEEKQFYKTTYNQYNSEVKSLFDLNSKTHAATIIDVTFWDELVKFTKTKDDIWYKKFIESQFESYDVDYIGIYNLDKQLINKTTSPEIKTTDFIPKKVIANLYNSKYTRFYIKTSDGVLEVFGATIHPSNDPEKIRSKPSGYFFMARLLDKDFLNKLGNISSSEISLVADNYLYKTEDDFVKVSLDLKDSENKSVAKLVFKRAFNLNYRNTKEILFIVFMASVINILFYLYFTKRWVYNPLKLITSVLETGSEFAIKSLKKTRGEFGYIGNLFEENNNQKKQLEIAKKKAEESDKLKSSFLANLSHEIRTPMNAIIGFSDLLDDPNLSENDKREYLKIIKNSGANLVSIIEDLIEMSKIDAKQIVPKYDGVDIEKCVKELYNSIQVTIPKEKQIEFYIQESAKKIEGKILTDEIKLKQILINLITNAIKFTVKGYVNFGYTVNKKQNVLEFRVADSGLGIDGNNLKVIFDRFRRIEDEFYVESSGLGLGLSITKAYVEMLGGTISVESKSGEGSVFLFTIPLKYDLVEKKAKPVYQFNVSKNSGNQTILVAEDDSINFLLLKKILELKNYKVLRASNGQEAVDMCSSNPNIDLVFMDIKMPILDGFKALKKVKKNRPNLPVIAQTAYSSAEDKEKINNAGFVDYITKPLNKEKIFELLEKIFAQKEIATSNTEKNNEGFLF
ncbi:MAG: response regulator [Flavobacterium sp.]|nr:response regulator [Flavobacterium sp.]